MPVLYSEILLDHFRHPRNYGDLPDADISYESFNPVCGDRIRVALKLNDRVVRDVRFKGDGCAISTAAASLLTELILGADLETISSLPDDGLISALESDIQPARLQCALLPLEALRAGLRDWNATRDCGGSPQ
jgi:nitrogen fixation protein NifU and related proteins